MRCQKCGCTFHKDMGEYISCFACGQHTLHEIKPVIEGFPEVIKPPPAPRTIVMKRTDTAIQPFIGSITSMINKKQRWSTIIALIRVATGNYRLSKKQIWNSYKKLSGTTLKEMPA